MHERKAYYCENIYQDPMTAIMSVLRKIAVTQKETALSLHANSTGVATEGVSGTLCHLCSCYSREWVSAGLHIYTVLRRFCESVSVLTETGKSRFQKTTLGPI